jgi:hypothetical protein
MIQRLPRLAKVGYLLGFRSYAVRGGDVGGRVARVIASHC